MHSLGGDGITAWTYPKSKFRLLAGPPDARTMTFSCNADAAFGQSTAEVVDHAKSLLASLMDKREESKVRHIAKDGVKWMLMLQVTDPGLDMERIEGSKDSLLKNCYEWILQDPYLREWQDGTTSSLLWINGDTGKGKTMLMIALVRELLNSISGKSNAVTFFFCQGTDPRINNAVSILRSLVWKLLWITLSWPESSTKSTNPRILCSVARMLYMLSSQRC